MKEITYEDWQKNPTPRVMRCWNSNVENKVQAKVIYVINHDTYPVITLTDNDVDLLRYKHCAEIEEPKTRRMTHKELSHWLRENPTREFRYGRGEQYTVFCFHSYGADEASEEVSVALYIRERDGEWKEPLVEGEE